jgi:putative DNA methylase
MFAARQLTAIVTLSDLVKEIDSDVRLDAAGAGLTKEEIKTYVQAIVTFLALGVDRCADFNNSLCGWNSSNQKVMHLFGRAAIPMLWDFAEANILGDSVGGWRTCIDYVADCVEVLTAGVPGSGEAHQIDAATGSNGVTDLLISTDPPYYDNIGYAALSDFFYVWLRRTIGDLYPDLFSTLLVPKMPELTASPELFGGDEEKAKSTLNRASARLFRPYVKRWTCAFH